LARNGPDARIGAARDDRFVATKSILDAAGAAEHERANLQRRLDDLPAPELHMIADLVLEPYWDRSRSRTWMRKINEEQSA
jgi:hypothetical protein